jgi:hypothetical protein
MKRIFVFKSLNFTFFLHMLFIKYRSNINVYLIQGLQDMEYVTWKEQYCFMANAENKIVNSVTMI